MITLMPGAHHPPAHSMFTVASSSITASSSSQPGISATAPKEAGVSAGYSGPMLPHPSTLQQKCVEEGLASSPAGCAEDDGDAPSPSPSPPPSPPAPPSALLPLLPSGCSGAAESPDAATESSTIHSSLPLNSKSVTLATGSV